MAEPTDPATAWTLAVARRLRADGVVVTAGQVLACVRGLRLLDAATDAPLRRRVGRVTLVSDPAGLAAFDRLGDLAGPPPRPLPPVAVPSRPDAGGLDAAVDRPGAPAAPDASLVAGRHASARERLRTRRFDALGPGERAAVQRALAELRVTTPRRRSRRRRPSRRGELDLGRSLDRAVAGLGEVIDPVLRAPDRRRRPLVVVLDVSGSMAPAARALLGFALAARRTAGGRDRAAVEVFAFGSRLTRLTRLLDRRDPDAALVAAASAVVDWDGGTRIGASLDALVREHGPRGVLRGAVVVVCSDGLERGDPALLGRAAGALRRRCHRLIWVTPLAGDDAFAPTQRGLAAALAHVDVLLPGHDLASVEELARAVGRAVAPAPRRAYAP